MGVKVGRFAKAVLGTYKIAEMGTWRMAGIEVDELDSSEFGDEFRTYEMGMGDYGTITVSGNHDPSDTNGQALLNSAHLNKSKIGNAFKLYVDNTSYYTPNITSVTDAGVFVKSASVEYDKAGLGKTEFTLRCTGPMVLV